MLTLVALCMVLGCSALPVADVTKLSVSQLLGHPITYIHGIPSFSVPAAVTATDDESEDSSDEITTAVHAIPYGFGIPHFSVPAVVTADDDSENSDEITTALHGFPYAIPHFSVPAVVAADDDSENSDEITTALHGFPYAIPHFAAAAAVPVLSTATVESKHLSAVDAAVPADTTKLTLTTEEQEVAAIRYVQPTFGNVLPYNNFPFNNFHFNNFPNNFYNFNYQHNPLTYSGAAGYPYHFGYPYNFGYTTTYAAAPEVAVPEDSSAEEED